MRYLTIFIILFSFVLPNGFAQNGNASTALEVTGIVTDKNNEPLIGANVIVKDIPGLGVITDIEGRYKIKIEPYNRLVFSYLGFKSEEVLVKTETVINVIMQEAESSLLEEVVITGTGAQKKINLTGAVTAVDVGVLKSSPSASITNALAGNVAGVLARQTSGQPGNNTSEFWIRGISTSGWMRRLATWVPSRTCATSAATPSASTNTGRKTPTPSCITSSVRISFTSTACSGLPCCSSLAAKSQARSTCMDSSP